MNNIEGGIEMAADLMPITVMFLPIFLAIIIARGPTILSAIRSKS
jgi:hypothetical protein